MGSVIDAHLHPENLMDAFLARLDIARKEFGLLVDLLDDAIK